MMKPSTPLEYVDKALAITMDRRDSCPQLPVYTSLINQLMYVRSVFDGTERDKSRLHDLTLGIIGAKEFEDTDAELARALMDVYYIAEQSANGLKIILPK
jgi:hypothetical protein